MLGFGSFKSRSCGGVTRRAFVQAGATLPWAWSLGANNAFSATKQASDGQTIAPSRKGKAKSVIMVWLWGGPSQLDTFDPKPDAPSEIR
ncbi:MAG: DUF1501 domain-containing protein, partial [Planctomycetales bacterium]|nr:DUF1501 domain-containing protein [Planctomycetales bacterium]